MHRPAYLPAFGRRRVCASKMRAEPRGVVKVRRAARRHQRFTLADRSVSTSARSSSCAAKCEERIAVMRPARAASRGLRAHGDKPRWETCVVSSRKFPGCRGRRAAVWRGAALQPARRDGELSPGISTRHQRQRRCRAVSHLLNHEQVPLISSRARTSRSAPVYTDLLVWSGN